MTCIFWMPKEGSVLPGITNNFDLEYYTATKKNGQALNVLMWNPAQGILREESKVQKHV